jgi:hypothetical protein
MYFDELESLCNEKLLTTALIHLIITSCQANDEKACAKILRNIYNRFKVAKHKDFSKIKEMILKDEESKFEIEASYEYIGLKLLYILKLFFKGK